MKGAQRERRIFGHMEQAYCNKKTRLFDLIRVTKPQKHHHRQPARRRASESYQHGVLPPVQSVQFDQQSTRPPTHQVRQKECPHADDTGRSAGSVQIAHKSSSSPSSSLEPNPSCNAPPIPPPPPPPSPAAFLPDRSLSDDSESDEVSPRSPPFSRAPAAIAAAALEEDARLGRPLALAVGAAPLDDAAGIAAERDDRDPRAGVSSSSAAAAGRAGAGAGFWPAAEFMAGVMPSRFVAL